MRPLTCTLAAVVLPVAVVFPVGVVAIIGVDVIVGVVAIADWFACRGRGSSTRRDGCPRMR